MNEKHEFIKNQEAVLHLVKKNTLYQKEKVMQSLVFSVIQGMFVSVSESSSHQSFPLASSSEAARLMDRQKGFLRHLEAQSKSSYETDVPTRAAFR